MNRSKGAHRDLAGSRALSHSLCAPRQRQYPIRTHWREVPTGISTWGVQSTSARYRARPCGSDLVAPRANQSQVAPVSVCCVVLMVRRKWYYSRLNRHVF